MFVRIKIHQWINYESGGAVVTDHLSDTVIDLTSVNLEMPLQMRREEGDYSDVNFDMQQRTFGRRYFYELNWKAIKGEELEKVRALLAASDNKDSRNLSNVGQFKTIDIQPIVGSGTPSIWDVLAQNEYKKYFPPLRDVVIEDSYQTRNLLNKYIGYFEDVKMVIYKKSISSLGPAGIAPVFETGGVV